VFEGKYSIRIFDGPGDARRPRRGAPQSLRAVTRPIDRSPRERGGPRAH
jgi:hypothetical protein